MDEVLTCSSIAVGLLVGIVLLIEVGRRIGLRRLALASALLAGYGLAGGKSRGWLHSVGFAAVMAASVYVILDLEFPRLGLIRVDAFDQVLVELRANMN